MTPEQRDELIHFILQCQSNTADHLQEIDRRIAENNAQISANSAEHEKLTAELRLVTAACHDLVEVARLHSRRLDRLDGLNS